MLTDVIEEMARDSRAEKGEEKRPFASPAASLQSHSPAPPPSPAPIPSFAPAPAPAQHAPDRPPSKAESTLELDELRSAIATLTRAIEGSPRSDGDLKDRVAALETRLEEQEQSVRYLLQLLIEWLDKEGRAKESRAA